MKWVVRTPAHNPFNVPTFHKEKPTLDIAPTPRCPDCETKLEISDNYLWYKWDCPRCNFKKRTWEAVDKIHKRVENIVDRDLEEFLEKNQHK